MAKKLLVLDLDSTLIFCSETNILDYNGCDVISVADFEFDLGVEHLYVKCRPHLKEFLIEMSQIYDLAVWSASSRVYIDTILNKILPPGVSLLKVYDNKRCTFKHSVHGDKAVYVIKKL